MLNTLLFLQCGIEPVEWGTGIEPVELGTGIEPMKSLSMCPLLN